MSSRKERMIEYLTYKKEQSLRYAERFNKIASDKRELRHYRDDARIVSKRYQHYADCFDNLITDIHLHKLNSILRDD